MVLCPMNTWPRNQGVKAGVAPLTTLPSDPSPQLEVLSPKKKYSSQETQKRLWIPYGRYKNRITNMAGVTDPDRQEEGRLLSPCGGREEYTWQLLVFSCPTVIVIEHVQKYQPKKCMIIKDPNSQKWTFGSHYQVSHPEPAKEAAEGEEISRGERRGL